MDRRGEWHSPGSPGIWVAIVGIPRSGGIRAIVWIPGFGGIWAIDMIRVWGDLGGERWLLANRVNAIDPYGIHRCFNYPTLNTNPFKY